MNPLVKEYDKKATYKNSGVRPFPQSDRGFQYISYDYKKLEKNISSTKVFLQMECCLDNQPIKLCWETFKEKVTVKKAIRTLKRKRNL